MADFDGNSSLSERDRADLNAQIDEALKRRKRKRDARPNGEGEPQPFARIEDVEAPEILFINGAKIEPEPVSWLWRNHLQRGALNLLAGRSMAGKSTIALSFTATITSGGIWPDNTAFGDPEFVIFWSGEDAIGDTLVPRFIAAGGERGNIHFIDGVREGGKRRPFSPAADMAALNRAVDKIGGKVGLIVLDPIAVAVRGDSHKNVETRVGLQPFCDLLAATGAAGLGVHHFSKNTSGGDPLDRVSGSLAFGALPRVVLAAARDLNAADDPRRVLMRAKVSNGPDWGGFDYRLERRDLDGYPGIEGQRVLWGAPIEGSARDVLAKLEEKPAAERPAMAFLREALKGGPRLAAEVIAEAVKAGIPERTLRHAFKAMGGTSERHGRDRGHFVVWELPRLDA